MHVKIGEPGVPVAVVERGRQVLVSLTETFEVCDHDFDHKIQCDSNSVINS